VYFSLLSVFSRMFLSGVCCPYGAALQSAARLAVRAKVRMTMMETRHKQSSAHRDYKVNALRIKMQLHEGD
jgi:hypothetical protein